MWSPIRQVLWFLLAGSRGGPTRARVLREITRKPSNMHQLSKKLKLDYKTVQHHMDILCDNNLVVKKGGYGAIFFPSPELEQNMDELGKIWEKTR